MLEINKQETKRTGGGMRWGQAALITVAAVAAYAGLRSMPTGSELHHMDFRLEGGNTLEFCDPANPQFIPVVAVRSPVRMTLVPRTPPTLGEETTYVLKLATSAGKPIGPVDLLVSHTRQLHLMVVDPTLNDYQHLHPEPGETAGEWVFRHTPRLAGEYRVFADFMPAATGRGLYASTDFVVPGEVAVNMRILNEEAGAGDYRFSLRPTEGVVKAGRSAELIFEGERRGGGGVPMEIVMDAYAHLTAFDVGRGGFAHLHPRERELAVAPDGERPRLTFNVTIPEAGLYVIWAQVKVAGEDLYLPFWFEVAG